MNALRRGSGGWSRSVLVVVEFSLDVVEIVLMKQLWWYLVALLITGGY